jgi:hypothetical protein
MDGLLINPCRHLAEFVEDVGPSDAPGTIESVHPSVRLEYHEPAVLPQGPLHDFVIVFRPERNLPPLAVRGSGVGVVDHRFAIWVAIDQIKTYVTVVNASDVVGVFEGKVEAFQTAT